MTPLNFDVAFRLKMAGFPQPEPQKWQTWVTDTGELAHIDKRFLKRVHFRSFGIDPKRGKFGRLIVERASSANVLSLKKWYYLPSSLELIEDLPMLNAIMKAPYQRLVKFWIDRRQNPDKFENWAQAQLEKELYQLLNANNI